MTRGPGPDTSLGGARRDFPATQWSRFDDDPAAAEELARNYWKPIYAYIRARWAKSNEDAKDIAQEFFIWMLESGFARRADPSRGRFRAFLKVALQHYLSTEDQKTRRQKRGGDRRFVDLVAADGAGLPDPKGRAPEEALDDAWRHELFARAAGRLEQELRSGGRETVFKVFRDYHLQGTEGLRHSDVAARYGISEIAVANHLADAKALLRNIVSALVAETVRGEEDLREELAALFGKGGP